MVIISICGDLWAGNSSELKNMNDDMKLRMGKVCVLKREKRFFFLVWLEDKIKKKNSLRSVPRTGICYQGQIFKKTSQYSPNIFTLE